MLYHLFYALRDSFSPFNIFKYITFRSGCAFVLSFLIVLFLGRRFISHLKTMKMQEHIDMYGHVHLEKIYNGKEGTPTMGGILIIFSIIISILLLARLDTILVWFCIFALVWFGFFGFLDDTRKMRTKKGLRRSEKLSAQILFGIILGVLLVGLRVIPTNLNLPFLKNIVVDLSIFYVVWVCLVVTSTTNAVNFTDGFDGLAIMSVVMVALVLSIVSYIVGHIKFSSYLFIPYVPRAGELTVVCAAIAGAGLGFLWFNSHPAEVFMGDVGSSALGGILGVVALCIRQECLLVIAGGLFVFEAFSVVLQICSVRFFGRRIFKAAPFHHHLSILGWKEPKIIARLWIISALFLVLSLLTLKIR